MKGLFIVVDIQFRFIGLGLGKFELNKFSMWAPYNVHNKDQIGSFWYNSVYLYSNLPTLLPTTHPHDVKLWKYEQVTAWGQILQ